MVTIYGLYSMDGELKYIGVTSRDLNYAVNHHRAAAKKNPVSPPVNVWINEVGFKNFQGKIIEETSASAETVLAIHTEAITVARMLGADLLNVTPEEHLERLRKAMVTPETRSKMSKAKEYLSGREKDSSEVEAWKKKISEANKGKTISVEQREAISRTHKGKTVSAETRAKLSEAAKGHSRTKGQKRSEETKEKMRFAKHLFHHVEKGVTNPECNFC